MLRPFIFSMALTLISSAAFAGQVLLSCDLRGLDDFGDVEFKQVDDGFRVNVFMRKSENFFYSLVWRTDDVPSQIELSAFSVFKPYPNALLKEGWGKWFFTANNHAPLEVSCVKLK